jgi:catechol 2,3-dioxygenase-like lactoylglutathione lyase family enzyme
MNLEIDVIPVSDVDRSKRFYERLGWRLDDDAAPLDGLRIVQFTPPAPGPRSHSARDSPPPRRARPWGDWSSPTSKRPMTSSSSGASKRVTCGTDRRSPRGPVTRRRSRAHQLWVVLLLQRPRRQCVAGPRGHDAAPWPGRLRNSAPMEVLVEFEVEVPPGTSETEVTDRETLRPIARCPPRQPRRPRPPRPGRGRQRRGVHLPHHDPGRDRRTGARLAEQGCLHRRRRPPTRRRDLRDLPRRMSPPERRKVAIISRSAERT